ncbi:MAG: DUF4340 domain-containing protein [Cyanobacteria bacterium J06592_8]
MKLQRSTLILMSIALGLAGYVYISNIQRTTQQQIIQEAEKQIFSFSRDDVKSVTVTTPEQTITAERIPENEDPEQSPWKLTQPVQTPANQATVDFLLNQLVVDQSIPEDPSIGLRRLTISEEELSKYGLDSPENIVEVTLNNDQTYKLSLGGKDFSGRSVYGQTQTPETEAEFSILVIPEGIISAVERPLEEWKLPEEEPETTETEIPTESLETVPEPDNSQTETVPDVDNTETEIIPEPDNSQIETPAESSETVPETENSEPQTQNNQQETENLPSEAEN